MLNHESGVNLIVTQNKNKYYMHLGIFLIGLVLLNLIARDNFRRLDLTDNKMYSLSNSS